VHAGLCTRAQVATEAAIVAKENVE